MGKPASTPEITKILLQSIADRASLNNGSASVSTFKLASLEQVLLRAQRKLEKSLPNEGDATFQTLTSKSKVFEEILKHEEICDGEACADLKNLAKSKEVVGTVGRILKDGGDSPYHHSYYFFDIYLSSGWCLKLYYDFCT